MQYISPEAIEGEVVDNRSDIYSLGCTAFHLLTGRAPFTGATIAATMSAHLTKPVPSACTVNEHLPERTDSVFERVLAKNPDDRYQSCAEFVTALQEAVGAGEVRYPASAPTLAAATSAKRRAVDPDAATQLRNGVVPATSPQRKFRAVPILTAAVGVLVAVGAATLGVYATRGGTGNTSTTATPATAQATPSSLSNTPTSLSNTPTAPPAPLPPVVASAPQAPIAVAGTLASGIVPGLVFPPGTVRACDEFSTSGPTYGVPPPGQCWEPGTERWRMQSQFGQAQRWMQAQMAQRGLEMYSTYGDGPSTSWGRGTDFRVTLEMNQNSNYVTDVYVVDINSVKGAR